MTEYRFHNIRRAANGQAQIGIVVGKTNRIAWVPLTRGQVVMLIKNSAGILEPADGPDTDV